jgi:penicillin-binding protein 2
VSIYEDLRTLRRRLEWCRWLMIAVFLGLCARYWQLQVLRSAEYREQAQANQVRQIPQIAPRGVIFDRRGRILAENRPSFNLTFEQSQNPSTTLAELAALVSVPEATLREQFKQKRRVSPYAPLLVKEDIAFEEVARIESRQLEFPETEIQFLPRRFYPSGSLASHVLGYVGRITDEQLSRAEFEGGGPDDYVGQSGVELVHNRRLMGKNGVQRVVVNSLGRRERLLGEDPPLWGDSIQLTLDLDLQTAVERAFGDRSGAAVVLDPRSGEIRALASFPAFDPNLFSGRFHADEWKALVQDERKVLQNRAIQGRYSPGSVFKLVMAAAALEEGVVTPETRFFCPGSIRLYGVEFLCHRRGGHGWVALHEAIVHSCNVYFYQVGVNLQIDRIARYSRALGLGSLTGVDLPFEVSGLIPDPDWKRRLRREPWYAGETVSVAVGQGAVLVTCLQLAQLGGIIAGGGELYRPHVVQKVSSVNGDSELAPPDRPEGPIRNIPFRESTWRELQAGMYGVVNEGGTGYAARLSGVEVCGKTGTAQVASKENLSRQIDAERPEHLRNHAWFVGYAPRKNPELALAVLVEHAGAGGQSAAPVAREIFRAYFEGKSKPEEPHARQTASIRN